MSKELLIDLGITVIVVIVTMTVVNRTPLAPYVSGEKKILGMV